MRSRNQQPLMKSLPSAIDLFAGVGGLSLGASRAGFDVRLAVELDEYAYDFHKKNFPNSNHLRRDVSEMSGCELLENAGLIKGELDALFGGPPCQGFSYMGNRNINDPRNHLFWHFFRLVKETQPKVFLAENVPGILNKKYSNFIANALSQTSKQYDLIGPLVLKACDYGAPTTRTRVFFLGVRKGLKSSHFEWPGPIDESLHVNVGHALRGLPKKIDPNWQSEKQSWKKVNYSIDTPFFDKVVNQVPLGLGCKAGLANITVNRVSGFLGTRHTKLVEDRYDNLRPGERDSVSKAIRLDMKKYCPTLRAGTGPDKGSHQAVRPVHPDQPRVITPREASRLQGFPDWFQFHPTKWHSFRQIGNSVSPIVAEYVFEQRYSVVD